LCYSGVWAGGIACRVIIFCNRHTTKIQYMWRENRNYTGLIIRNNTDCNSAKGSLNQL
jgi:hypothetical protein